MSGQELQVRALERDSPAPIQVAGEAAVSSGSPLRKVHRILRGRYHWAVLLALLGMVGGGYVGWHFEVPVYESRGLIYIEPSMPSPQDPSGRDVLPMFTSFVAAQVQLLHTSITSEMAMRTEAWKLTGEPGGPLAVEDFEERRRVLHSRGMNHIMVSFTDSRKEVALAGVKALIRAYQERARELNNADRRLEATRSQVDVLNGKIRNATIQVLGLTEEYGGVEGMQVQHLAAVEDALEASKALRKVQLEIRNMVAEGKDGEVHRDVSTGEIAVESPTMAGYLDDLKRLEDDAELLSRKATEMHDDMIHLRKRIERQKERIETFAAEWNKALRASTSGRAPVEHLRVLEKDFEAAVADQWAVSRKIGETRAEVERLEAEKEDHNRELDKMQAMRDQIENQLLGSGRIKIFNPGSMPVSYSRDKRVPYAAVGGFLGGALGLLIVLLLGLLDRRLKNVRDVDHDLSSLRILGLFPTIPLDLSDPQGGQMAIHCVHQIRTLLQIGYAGEGGTCIGVTGAGVGSGKTTLSTALGLSFASSGSRTVLIDGDLTGRGLTRRVSRMLWQHARQALGRADVEERAPTQESDVAGVGHRLLAPLAPQVTAAERPSLEELRDLLFLSVSRLGAEGARKSGIVADLFALADLHYAAEGRVELTTRLRDTLSSLGQGDAGSPPDWLPPSVVEFEPGRAELNGTPLERYLYPTGVEGLSFLPLRGLGQGGEVSITAISNILARVRKEFDIALVDTGPVLGTVETSMVAAQADGVVLVVSPGDQRPLAERAVAHLEDIGARLAGVVFNRAGQKEVYQSSMSYYSTAAQE